MKKILFYLLPILTLINLPKANCLEVNNKKLGKASNGFVENKGQVHNQFNEPNKEVKYSLALNGLNLHLTSHGFSYDTYTKEYISEANAPKSTTHKNNIASRNKPQEKPYNLKFHRIDVELIGSNRNPKMIEEGKSSDYINYYTTGTTGDEATEVYSYEKITYLNIYTGIDLEFVSQTNGNKAVKYNFIVHPGADMGLIKLKYHGAVSTALIDGRISIALKSDKLEESIPESYELETGKKSLVYYEKIGENEYGFATKESHANNTLVIDPYSKRIWGTYYGDMNEDSGYTGGLDSLGNIYMGGYTSSTGAIATSGAYQTTLSSNGVYDCFVVKFTNAGVRLWGTYYGGTGMEFMGALAVEKSGIVYFSGRTESNNLIATVGAHQTTYGGNTDAFLVKLNANGGRLWGTYCGGSLSDVAEAIALDPLGGVVIGGSTVSTSGIATAGAHQTAFGGNEDGFVAKFNANGVRLWGTYYGGTGLDLIRSVCYNNTGNAYIQGLTESSNAISTAGAHQTVKGSSGFADAFIVKFSPTGGRMWGTYYGGSSFEEAGPICTDSLNNIYVGGRTDSPNNMHTSNCFDSTFSGLEDGYIAKFNGNGVRLWGTYLGNSGREFVNSMVSDSVGNIFFSNATNSTGLATPGAHQFVNGGTYDGMIVKFNPLGEQLYATYYGGNNSDNLTVSAIDRNGGIYAVGSTTSTMAIATTGSHQPSASFGSDAFLVKLFDCTMDRPVVGGPKNLCSNSSAKFGVQALPGHVYTWTSTIGGTILAGQNTDSVTVSFLTGGANIVCRDSIIATGCVMSSANYFVNVFNPNPIVTSANTACAFSQGSASLTNITGRIYTWAVTRGSVISGQGTNAITIQWDSAGTGNIVVTDSAAGFGCKATSPVKNVTLNPVPNIPTFTGLSLVCVSTVANYLAPTNPGRFYRWMVTGGNITSGANSNSMNVNWGAAGVGSVTLIDSFNTTGCKAISSPLQTTINAKPTQPVITGLNSVCTGVLQTYSVPYNAGRKYKWFSNGGSVQGITDSNVVNIIFTTTSSSYINAIDSVTATGCKTTSSNLSISHKQSPAVPVITGPTSICENTSGTYVTSFTSGRSYKWTINGGSISAGQNTSGISALWGGAGSGSLILLDSNISNNCKTSSLPYNVTKNLVPTPSISGLDSVCANSIGEYTVDSNSGRKYTWTVAGGYIYNGQNTHTLQAGWMDAGLKTLTLKDSVLATGCNATVSKSIFVNPQPIISISGPLAVCANDIKTYFTNANSLNYRQWSIIDGLILGSANSDTIRVKWGSGSSAAVQLRDSVTTTGCTNLFEKLVAINVNPSPVISGKMNICANGMATYQTPSNNGRYYIWNVVGGAINGTGSASGIDIAWNNAGLGTLTVLDSNTTTGCKTLSNEYSVNIYPNPAKPIINGTNNLCENSNYVYAIASDTGKVSLWNLSAGQILSGQGSSSLSIKSSVVGQAKLMVIDSIKFSGCKTSSDTLFLTVNNKPTPIITGKDSICENAPEFYSTTANLNRTYNWQVTGGIINAGQSTNSIEVKWSNAGLGTIILLDSNTSTNCSGLGSKQITKIAFPEPINIIGKKDVFDLSTYGYSVQLEGGINYFWKGTNGNIISGQGTNAVQVMWGNPGSGKLLVQANRAGCTVSDSITVNIGVTGLEDQAIISLKVYPNPAKDLQNLEILETTNQEFTFEVLDMHGKAIETPILKVKPGMYQLNTKDLAAGVYLVYIHAAEQVLSYKLIKL
jgi:hypothetical protein